MRLKQRVTTACNDTRFSFSALVLVTGLLLTLQNPQARDSAAELLTHVDLPNPARVFEMRPRTPPPGMEGDELTMEDNEQLQPAVIPDREVVRTTDLRAGRER